MFPIRFSANSYSMVFMNNKIEPFVGKRSITKHLLHLTSFIITFYISCSLFYFTYLHANTN